MADRLIPTTYATPTLALAAAGVGDRIVFEAGAALSYVAQGLSKPGTANIQWVNNRGAQILLTPANNTSFEPGSGWIVGEAAGSGFGFDITLTAGNSPGAAGGIVYISSGKSCTFYDSSITGISTGANAIRVEAGASAAAVTLHRSSVHAYAINPNNPAAGEWGVALVVNGGAATCTVTARDCTFYGDGASGGVGIYAQVAARSQADLERCDFREQSWGVYLAGASAAVGVQARYCEFTAHNHYGIEHAAAGDPPLVMKRCIFANNTLGDYKPIGARNGVVADSNYFEVMEVQVAAGTWAKNHYDTVIGAPGATDVHTPVADAHFLNFAGSDFHIDATSALREVGNDAGGDGLDFGGDPAVVGLPDVGPYEFQAVNCGIASVTQPTPTTATVTFVASPAGPQIPLQASAETEANWLVSGDAGPLTLVSAVRAADLLYVLTFDRDIEPGETIAVDSSAVATDTGGLCDDPGTDSFVSVFGGLLSATLDDAETLRLTFKNGGAGTAPTEADVLDPANVGASGALPGLSAVSVAKISAFVYLVTLARPTTLGEACTVDLTVGAPVTTVGGGEVAVPATLPFVGVQWANGAADLAEALSPTEIRVTFDDAVWLSWPSLGSAGQVASWTVRLKGGSVALALLSVRMESRYAYVLTLTSPMANRPYEVVTDGVATVHGGTCA